MSWLLLLAASAPMFVVEGELSPEVADRAAIHWQSIGASIGVDEAPKAPIRIRLGRLKSSHDGRSTLGVIDLRRTKSPGATRAQDRALRHEVAHQFLLATCPKSARDRLFHEAFAMWVSGETSLWLEGPYQSVAHAAAVVRRARSLDRPSVRRAIARLLAEVRPDGHTLKRRFEFCGRGAWPGAMTALDLAHQVELPAAAAVVVLSRHTGAVLESSGAAALPMPFGSTLKPFIVAGQSKRPRLTVDLQRWAWASCAAQGAKMESDEALLGSCNGYFLDWARRTPAVVELGRYRTLFSAFDVVFRDAAEAIGLRPTARLSAFHLAQAYRVLAEASPDVIETLRRNVRTGTLANLGFRELDVATKTGTVRDVQSHPTLGWIVMVDADLVVVVARPSSAPRTFFKEAVGVYRRHAERTSLRTVPVGDDLRSCAAGGLQIEITAERIRVDEPVGKGSFLCLGSSTNHGAGVIENGALRTTDKD